MYEGLIPFSNRSVARTCATVTFAAGLLLLFLASALRDTHAAGAAAFIFPSGVAFAALSPLVWRGKRWAMSLACFVAVGFALAAINNSPGNLWFFLSLPLLLAAVALVPYLHWGARWAIGCLAVAAGFMLARGSVYEARYVLVLPALFAALLLTHAAARPGLDSVTPQSPVAARILAALVYAYGALVTFLGPLDHTNALGAPIVSSYALALGAALGALCIFVWRGRVWAMISVCLLTLAQWVMLALLDPVFWGKAAYSAAPAVFAALTAVSVATSGARTRHSCESNE